VRAAQRAVDLETRRGAPGNRLLDALTTLALADTAVGDYAGAVAAYHRAESVIQREGLDATLEYAVVLNNWSVMMQSAGQHRTSAALSERAVNVARQTDSENGASLTMLAAWGNALTAIGDFARAKVALDESLVKATSGWIGAAIAEHPLPGARHGDRSRRRRERIPFPRRGRTRTHR
jgi:tetratricopeptide (TPR) repeat protein